MVSKLIGLLLFCFYSWSFFRGESWGIEKTRSRGHLKDGLGIGDLMLGWKDWGQWKIHLLDQSRKKTRDTAGVKIMGTHLCVEMGCRRSALWKKACLVRVNCFVHDFPACNAHHANVGNSVWYQVVAIPAVGLVHTLEKQPFLFVCLKFGDAPGLDLHMGPVSFLASELPPFLYTSPNQYQVCVPYLEQALSQIRRGLITSQALRHHFPSIFWRQELWVGAGASFGD